MTQQAAIIADLATALNEIEHLKMDVADLKANEADTLRRLRAYDLLAAKWGGVCMLAVAIGTGVISYSDKLKSFWAWVSKQ